MAQGDLTRIASNISGLNALNALKAVNTKLSLHQLRLSTGRRINEAADDPAGLTIATKLNYKSRGLGVALDNIGDAKNLLAVAEGGLSKINDILLVIRDKAEQAANDTLGADERTAIKEQIQALLDEINTIVNETEWNGQKLLDGTFINPKFQTGFQSDAITEFSKLSESRDVAHLGTSGIALDVARAIEVVGDDDPNFATFDVSEDSGVTAGQELATGAYSVSVAYNATSKAVTVSVYDANGQPKTLTTSTVTAPATGTLSFDTGVGIKITVAGQDVLPSTDTTRTWVVNYTAKTPGEAVSSGDAARQYVARLDEAIKEVSSNIKDIGALVSRLTFKEENLTVAKTNTEAAYNRIMNADIAAEQLEAMKYQILQQTATAMLAQANVAPQAVLGLFR